MHSLLYISTFLLSFSLSSHLNSSSLNIFFNNSFVENFSIHGNDFYSFIIPSKISNPIFININDDVANILGIPTNNKNAIAEYFSGNKIMRGMDPVGMAYAGHQFGYFTPLLGDGRASLLGEIYVNNVNWALHAKGTGPTPYSRGGDGRAVLRSSVREYLCSEAMHYLGIPSSRSLSIVGSTSPVFRETVETAAVVVRVAPVTAFIRFGTFELFASRNQKQNLEKLTNYVISHDFQHLMKIKNTKERIIRFLKEIAKQTGELVAKWMAFGFAHGVLNTDNMSILSYTIDFGPFGFMDEYNPHFIPNHSDDEGRYAFDQQVAIGKWNLERLVDAMQLLVPDSSLKIRITDTYDMSYNSHYEFLMQVKLGLKKESKGDENLWKEILDIMYMGGVDYTNFFRALSSFSLQNNISLGACESVNSNKECELYRMMKGNLTKKRFTTWLHKYSERLQQEGSIDSIRQTEMKKINPKYILRNYLAHVAIENAKQGNFSEIDTLLHLLQHPYEEQPEMNSYALPTPSWAKTLEVSCSS